MRRIEREVGKNLRSAAQTEIPIVLIRNPDKMALISAGRGFQSRKIPESEDKIFFIMKVL
jgi:hypothetical protein